MFSFFHKIYGYNGDGYVVVVVVVNIKRVVIDLPVVVGEKAVWLTWLPSLFFSF